VNALVMTISVALIVITLLIAHRAGERIAWTVLAVAMSVIATVVVANHPYI